MASGNTLAILTPGMNQPPGANYTPIAFRNGRMLLAFDAITQWTAIFATLMPRNYAGGGFTVAVNALMASATAGTLGWGVTLERLNPGNRDLDFDFWATEQMIAPFAVDATAGKVMRGTVVIAAGAAGTDSIAAGDDFRVRLRRDAANDTAAGDAHFLSLEIRET